MTIRHLRIFKTVCEYNNNMTKAAQVLFISQPAISIAISELEQYYEVRLFDRLGKRLYLTAEGEELYKYTLRILSIFDEMDQRMKDRKNAEMLRIGASPTIGTFLMPSLARAYQDHNPASELSVRVTFSRNLEQMLIANELDLALVEIPIHESLLYARPFFEDSLDIIKPYHELSNDSIKISELCSHQFVLREKHSGTRTILDAELEKQNICIVPIWESTNFETLLEAVYAGIGWSVVPRMAARNALKNKKVSNVSVIGLNLSQKFYIVSHKDKIFSQALISFIDLLFSMVNEEVF